MKTYHIPHTELEVTRIAYGCMPLGGSWDDGPISEQTRQQAMSALKSALDAGINFFDHSDIYCRGKSEEVFSDLWEISAGIRPKILLQSKCGIRFEGEPDTTSPHRFDFSYEHILQSVEGSLRRLKTDYLDILLLHRPDALVEPEEVARAVDYLYQSGKVRYFGVSNHTAAQIALLQKFVEQPILFNQVELNVIHTHLLDEGISFNQNISGAADRNEGTIEYCRQHDITLQAWGPLAWGRLSGRPGVSLSAAEQRTADVVAKLARQKDTSREAILVAWLLRHPAHIQPVIGTTNPQRIQASCLADGIELSREEWYTLFTAGRGENLP